MFSNAPQKLLMTALVLPLSTVLPNVKTLDRERLDLSSAVSEALAYPKVERNPEYIKNGPQRILRVRGKNLNALHTKAAAEFIHKMETEIKPAGNRFTMSQFETDVREENGEFVFEYRIRLNPAQHEHEVHRIVSMIGTVQVGGETKKFVQGENTKKMPQLKRQIGDGMNGRKIWYEVAKSEHPSPQGVIFHEAVLAKGAFIH